MVGNDGQTRIGKGLWAVCVVGTLAVAAQAQQDAREYMTINTTEALVRCAAGSYYYPVTRLRDGDVVVATGEDGEWTQIEYPAGCRAFVGSDVAERNEGVIRIVEPTRLKAANLNYGFRGSWKAVFDEPLAPGATLTLIDPIVDEDGMTTAFLVEAPLGATGFIHETSLRASTTEEIAQFKASLVPETDMAEETEQETDIAANPVDPPTIETPGDDDALAGPSDIESLIQAEDQPLNIVQEPGVEQNKTEEQVAGPTTREVASPAALEAAFETVFRQDVIEAEYDELIAEFERALESLDTSTPEGKTLQTRLMQRKQVLELKRDLQKEKRALAEATRQIDERATKLAEQIAALGTAHSYTIVGRLVPSTVYNGDRLPLMYRIQSVGQAVPRTLGYIRPNESKDVTGKLGEVVGVVGDAALDRSLKLRVVRPERIDVLAPAIAGVPDEDG